MMLGLVAFLWYVTMPSYLSHLSMCFSSDVKTLLAISTFEFVRWFYDVANSAPVIFVWDMFSRMHYCSSLSCLLWGFKDDGTHPYGETQGSVFAQPFIHFLFGSNAMAPGKFKFSDVGDVLLFMLLVQAVISIATVTYLMFLVRARNSRERAQKAAPGVENLEWQGPWEDMGKFLESGSVPTTWKLTPEQLLNPTEIMTAVRERGRGKPVERQVADACGAFAVAYRNVLGMVQHIQEKGKDENEVLDTRVTQDKAKSKRHTKPVEDAPIQKRKYKTRLARPVDDDGEAGPSQAPNPEPGIITESLRYNKLRSLRADVIRYPNESILTWMIRVWDSTGDAIKLDGGEARFLRSIAQDVGIEEVFVREPKPLSLWARLLDAVRERFIYRDLLQTEHYAKGWKTMEEGIQRLREMALLEVLFGRDGQYTSDPDKVKCTPLMWWTFTRMGPSAHASYLTSLQPGEKREPVVSVTNKLWLYGSVIEGPLQACISTLETLLEGLSKLATRIEDEQAKRLRALRCGGRWSKCRHGEVWQVDYITLPLTRQGKRCVLTMVEATTGWLETHPFPHVTARNTILGLERQVLWRHGTPERIESDDGTHFENWAVTTWAKEHGIEWVCHTPSHAAASGRVKRCNGLLKTTLKALGGGTLKKWDQHLAKATWLVNTGGSSNELALPSQSLCTL
ncbi:hypothetical protein BTVI_93882 [Pitangus sulphuratus]|nr:hypothetical protein BTVI_93882 [Pitangus sulphuratus]